MRVVICIYDDKILRWFLYFSYATKLGWKFYQLKGFVVQNSGIFRFATALKKKKRFNNFVFFPFCVVIASSSTKVILLIGSILLASKGLTVF